MSGTKFALQLGSVNMGNRKVFIGQTETPITDFSRLYPMLDVVNREYRTSLRPVSLRVAVAAFSIDAAGRSTLASSVCDHAAKPIDALIAFEQPGVPLGAEIVYTKDDKTFRFRVPAQYCGQSDIGLFVPGLRTSDFEYAKKARSFVFPEGRVFPLQVPAKTGFYRKRDANGMPNGERVVSFPEDAVAKCSCTTRAQPNLPYTEEHIAHIPGSLKFFRPEGPYVGPLTMSEFGFLSANNGNPMIRALAVEVGPEDLEKLDIIPLTSTIHFGMTQNELWGVLQSARTGLKLLGHPESSPNLMLLNSVIAGQKPYMALDFTGKGGDLLTCSTLGTFAAHQPQPDWSIIPASARVSQLRESDFRSKITEFNTTLERALSIASAAIITSAGELLRRFADVMQKVVFSPDF